MIFQIFTNFDALATGLAMRAVTGRGADRCLPVLPVGLRGETVSIVLSPAAAKGHPGLVVPECSARHHGRGDLVMGESAGDAALPRGWLEFFRLGAATADSLGQRVAVVRHRLAG